MISNCGSDERGQYHGGTAGDNNGKEWRIINWYNRPWKCVLRHPDVNVRKKLAEYATKAANNNNIGYDQWQRYTFYEALKAANWDIDKITTPVETDCSAGVAAIVIAVGNVLGIDKMKNVPYTMYTGNERSNLKSAGFEVLTDSKYLNTEKYLLEGDILLNDTHHTAINLTTGSKAETPKIQNEPKKSTTEIANEVITGKWGNGSDRKNRLETAGYNYSEVQAKVNELLKKPTPAPTPVVTPSYTKYRVKVNTTLNVRKGPGTNYARVSSLTNGTIVEVVKTQNGWMQLKDGNWVAGNYLVKV